MKVKVIDDGFLIDLTPGQVYDVVEYDDVFDDVFVIDDAGEKQYLLKEEYEVVEQ